MEESVLITIKKLLGIHSEDTNFDTDIIVLINSAFSRLYTLAVGPNIPFRIKGKDEKWIDFMNIETEIESVKTYIYLKTKIVFDPPQMGYLVESIKDQIKELEWILNVQTDKTH